MSPIVLVVLVVVGLLVGFASGLIGIGGGVLIVPFLYFFYNHPNLSGAHVPEDMHTLMATATSLFIVVPTAIWGAIGYSKKGLVIWRAALPIAIASVLAAIVGAKVAQVVPAASVRIAFGAFLLITGMQLLWSPHPLENRPLQLKPVYIIATGLTVGFLSGLMGIGGGAIAAAMLIYLIGLDLKQAAATSLAVAGMAAIAAMITHMVDGLGVAGRPPGSIGYVHALAALPILIGSLVAVRVGAAANQRMPVRTLRRVFAFFFSTLGVYLIWQNVDTLRSAIR